MNTNKKIKQAASIFLLGVFSLSCIYLFSGCGRVAKRIKKATDSIPNIEFDLLEWERGGNISSALFRATGAHIEDGKLIVDEIRWDENWPVITTKFTLKGLRRPLKDETP